MTDQPLDPSGIAQFVKHGRCPRYLKQRVDPGEEPSAREWREAFGLMNIALLGHGREFEASQVDVLTTGATTVLGPADATLPNDGGPAIDTTWRDSARGRTAQLHEAIDTAAALPANPEFARREERFILNPRRLLVAILRSRFLTVVVCSTALFEVAPADSERLDNGPAWTRLFTQAVGRDTDPAWTGSLGEFVGNQTTEYADVPVQVYPSDIVPSGGEQ